MRIVKFKTVGIAHTYKLLEKSLTKNLNLGFFAKAGTTQSQKKGLRGEPLARCGTVPRGLNKALHSSLLM